MLYIMQIIFLCLFLNFMAVAPVSNAAESQLMNLPNQMRPPLTFSPGSMIILPDGRRTIIESILPNGDLQTQIGLTLSPEGIVRDDPNNGQAVLVEPVIENNQGAEMPIPAPATEPGGAQPEVKQTDPTPGIQAMLPTAPQTNSQNPDQTVTVPVVPKEIPQQPDNSAKTPLTLAQMLPLTQNKPEQTNKEDPTNKQEQPKAPVKEQKKPEKPASPKEKPKAPQKPKIGEELRIPPEAAKTGNLDFLEGCWQGTRPEYYSKRTIKECFCFGAQGKNGKRRVIDPIGHRNCIGATKANLSSSGVLSVTSQGAACDDGERWGQAEMICKNSGPKTPCSWVFRDANNGRQSYTIPFVRVEACGR